MAEKIRYDIDVNARDGVRELDRLGKAGREAGKDLEQSFDDAASAADKAAAAIVEMASKMDTELRAAADASDALAQALGPELTSKMDVDQVVVDLNKMGVTFDEIRADADKFAAALKQVDDIKMSQTTAGLDGMKGKLDTVEGAATGAKSSLANMIGNTAQDVSGLSNSLGVAIGQMAEYSSDAILAGANSRQAFKDMALVAGPIAGLALLQMGIQAVTGSFGSLRRSQEQVRQETEDFSEAVREAGSVTEALNQAVSEGTEFTGQELAKPWQELMKVLPFVSDEAGDVVREQDNLIGAMADAGVTADEWTTAVSGVGTEYGELSAKLQSAKISGQISEDQFDLLIEQLDLYRLRTIDATEAEANRQKVFSEAVRTSGEITAGINEQRVAMGATDVLWQRLIRDAKDGAVETERATEAYNRLQTELGLTNTEMDALVAEKVNEQLEADAAAAGEAADKIAEMGDTIKAAQDAAAEYSRVVSGMDWGATSAQAAETAITGYFDKWFAAGDEAASQEEAYEGLAGALAAASEAGLSFSEQLFSVDSPEGRQVRQALREIGDTLIPDIQQAYDDAEGDQESFRKNMAILGERTLVRLQHELGIGRDEANVLAQQLGLIPENVDTMYKLIGDEEAKLKLGLLQTAIDHLPDNVNTKVTQQIIMGDYQGALATVQNYYSTHGATIPVDADMSQAYQALSNFAAAVRGARILANVAASFNTQSATAASAPASSAVASMSLAATPVASTQMVVPHVTIQTAVIGSRHSVQRAVASSLRSWTRLNGRRLVTR